MGSAAVMTRLNIWFPFYIGDYRAETQGLTHEERGIFIDLLCAYCHRQQPLPDDDEQLARLTGLSLRRWKKARKAIEPIFTLNEGTWTLPRLDEQIARAHEISKIRSEAGRLGGLKKAANRLANAQANATSPTLANAVAIKDKDKDINTNCISSLPSDKEPLADFARRKSNGGKE